MSVPWRYNCYSLVGGQLHFISNSSVKTVHFKVSNWNEVDEFVGGTATESESKAEAPGE